MSRFKFLFPKPNNQNQCLPVAKLSPWPAAGGLNSTSAVLNNLSETLKPVSRLPHNILSGGVHHKKSTQIKKKLSETLKPVSRLLHSGVEGFTTKIHTQKSTAGLNSSGAVLNSLFESLKPVSRLPHNMEWRCSPQEIYTKFAELFTRETSSQARSYASRLQSETLPTY